MTTSQTNEQRITALAQAIGTDVKGILASIGNLSSLTASPHSLATSTPSIKSSSPHKIHFFPTSATPLHSKALLLQQI